MNAPARWDNEDPRKLTLAPEDGPRSYLQHSDGSWSFVGDDGWPVSPEEFHEEVMSAIAAATIPVIDMDPVSVSDTEIR
ncbi:MAG: hypothetical protein JWN03_3655 [Nocardia sp.]|uniref:hypothetical protein n=1 Tax=Nocardia sp. TaxID=1821 RepID=UPI0026153714|nr:hypothetical protein [Nocardia sp.]MCU1643380.1 hypothetical protein [Nocardia sp.]